jgi:hypothetical protein
MLAAARRDLDFAAFVGQITAGASQTHLP